MRAENSTVFNTGLTTINHCVRSRLSHWYQRSLPIVIFVKPLVPMVPLVKTVGIIGRTLNARSVLYTVRVGHARVSDRGQTKCKHCIVIRWSWGVDVFDPDGSD